MKRIVALCLAACCLLLTGCGQVWEDLGNISSDIGQMGKPTESATVPPTQAPTEPPHMETIPWILMQTDENLFGEEYTPTVRFRQDGTCDLKLNMAEFMAEVTGQYQIKSFQDGSRVILCTYDPAIVGGEEGKEKSFFLLEKEPGVWTFHGEGAGLTWTGGLFYPAGAETLTLETELLPVYTPDTGLYVDVTDEMNTLMITKDAGDVLGFDVEWYRLTGMEGVTAYVFGNYAFFEYYTEQDGEQHDWTAGYLEMVEDQSVRLVIADSRLPHMDPGMYTFQPAPQQEIS